MQRLCVLSEKMLLPPAAIGHRVTDPRHTLPRVDAGRRLMEPVGPHRGVAGTRRYAGGRRPPPHCRQLPAVTCGLAGRCATSGTCDVPSKGPAIFSRGLSSGAGKSPQRRWKRATSCESCRLRSSSAMVSRDPARPTCSHARPCPRRAPWPGVTKPGAPSAGRAGRRASQQVRRPGPSARPARREAQVSAYALRTKPTPLLAIRAAPAPSPQGALAIAWKSLGVSPARQPHSVGLVQANH